MSTPVTPEGRDKLRQQLTDLQARIPVIRQQIRDAREKGDLRENAEYHAAREELALTEANIADLTNRLAHCVVVDSSQIDRSRVCFGATVVLTDLADHSAEEWTLVGDGEDDPLDNRILTSSPLGQALLGHCVGDEVAVTAPAGRIHFRITGLRYDG
jgi:transcription elongation factor GreA